MLLKRYKLRATIQVRYREDWEDITVNLKRHKDSEYSDELNYCSKECKLWDDTNKSCLYDAYIDCDDFDTTNYTYVIC